MSDMLKDYLYTDIDEPVRLGFGKEVKLSPDFSIYNISGTWFWRELTNENEVNLLIKFLNEEVRTENVLVCGHGSFGLEKISMESKISFYKPCYLVVKTDKKQYEIKTDLSIRKLGTEYIDFVAETYRMIKDSPDRIKIAEEFINHGMFGGFSDDRIVGFIGVHSEGAIGMLEILPEYNHRGYGSALEMYLCNYLLSQGRIPYCNVIYDNQISLILQRKLNLHIFGDNHMLYWGENYI